LDRLLVAFPHPPAKEIIDALVGRELRGRFKYRIEGVLGQGGTSTVYRGELLAQAKPVAIKVLHAESAAIPEMARRFEREVSTAKRIEHPNVVSVSDSGTLEDGGLFLVMELLIGTSLGHLMHDKGRIEIPRAVAITRQVLGALEAAHSLGIVHRDVKPSNVFLVDHDGKETVKLFDFGIALNDKAAIKLTAAGTAFGTPEYISPEMAMGLKVDGRADLYSLGVVLYEMVTGRLPFIQHDNPMGLLKAHINEAPPSPREVAPEAHISKELEAFILRTIAKKPEARPATASAMRKALLPFEPGAPRQRSTAWVLYLTIFLALAALALFFWLR
jgi:serine/threonine protein kinase